MSISALHSATSAASDPLSVFRSQKSEAEKNLQAAANSGSGGSIPQAFLDLLHKGTNEAEAGQKDATGDQSAEAAGNGASKELREAFNDFVGQTFYSQMLSTLRKSVQKSAYFDGGRGEEVFQGQLDQVIVEKLSDASASNFAGPMFDLFTAQAKLNAEPASTTNFTA